MWSVGSANRTRVGSMPSPTITAATGSEGTAAAPTRTKGMLRLTGPSASTTRRLWPSARAAAASSGYGRVSDGRGSNESSGVTRAHGASGSGGAASITSDVASAAKTTLPAARAASANAWSDSAPVQVSSPTRKPVRRSRSVNRTS